MMALTSKPKGNKGPSGITLEMTINRTFKLVDTFLALFTGSYLLPLTAVLAPSQLNATSTACLRRVASAFMIASGCLEAFGHVSFLNMCLQDWVSIALNIKLDHIVRLPE